ncbi:Protein SHORT-ROOT [Linum grandiflorum]
MWALNELASPYGDTQQKLASYFLHAIFSRIANSGRRSLLTLSSASDRTSSFDSTRKLLLRFQEASPWSSFGHVSSNGAILESLGAHPKLHVLDFSNTFCTQWPTFLESLATRFDDTPHLRLTSVLVSGGPGERLMNEISELNFDGLGIRDDEALAINCIGSLRSVSRLRRDYLFSRFRKLRPRIVTLCLRWFGVYFECLDESFPKTSNERLVLERRAGRAILDLVACSPEESTERREMAERWSARLRGSGFLGVELSEEVSDDVKALLRRYKEGWSLRQTGSGGGMLLCWKEQPVVWASAWRPIED